MKKLIATASLAALGAASVQAAAPASIPSDKPWSLSASLRGFYDDNYSTLPNGPAKKDSFGFQLSPTAAVGVSNDQTSFGARFSYTLTYYEARDKNSTDQSYVF